MFRVCLGPPAKVAGGTEVLSINAIKFLISLGKGDWQSFLIPTKDMFSYVQPFELSNPEPDLSIATKHSRSHAFWKLGRAGREICQCLSIYTFKAYEETGGARGPRPARDSLQS